ncbi:hypothetical protein D1007_31193 [Hordeum vulgare]|nr:hypothetical protein D1007_31193 [Hordeum vulgare]
MNVKSVRTRTPPSLGFWPSLVYSHGGILWSRLWMPLLCELLWLPLINWRLVLEWRLVHGHLWLGQAPICVDVRGHNSVPACMKIEQRRSRQSNSLSSTLTKYQVINHPSTSISIQKIMANHAVIIQIFLREKHLSFLSQSNEY